MGEEKPKIFLIDFDYVTKTPEHKEDLDSGSIAHLVKIRADSREDALKIFEDLQVTLSGPDFQSIGILGIKIKEIYTVDEWMKELEKRTST